MIRAGNVLQRTTVSLTGKSPADMAWNNLAAYVRQADPADVRSGKLDKHLDALDSLTLTSAYQYQLLSELYQKLGMTERQQEARARAAQRGF